MSETLVTILNGKDSDDHHITIRVNGKDANFEIKSERIEASFNRNLNGRLSDFIDIASCIFAADSRISRGSKLRPNLGSSWRRRLNFRFAVREPEFWRQEQITKALKEVVQFMTDDILEFDFKQAENLPIVQSIFEFGMGTQTFEADDIILFSGGLDSLAGAYERLSSAPGKIILLSHISANKRVSYAKNLVDRLKSIFPGRILWVPVTAHLNAVGARETTQRTRSLLFACLGFVTAKLSGAGRVHFYENGIVSANLPISAQVIGTMASRTTHPQTLQGLAALFNAIAPGEVVLDNPYSLLTKAQVVGRLADLGGAELIRQSVSCSHVRQRTILHPHCGACSQCLDRRFGVLAAGLAAYDPTEGYEIEVLTGPRPTGESRILTVDWVRHALSLAEMSDDDFLRKFGAELARLTAARPDLSAADHARAIVSMHRVHGEGVFVALTNAISQNSDALVRQQLPETALLRMVVAERLALPAPPAAVAMGFNDEQKSRSPGDIYPLQVQIGDSAESAWVTILGLGEIRGMTATPAWALKWYHIDDRQADTEYEDFRFMPGGALGNHLNVSKQVVRQRIKRLREEFAELYEVIEGMPPQAPILIHSGGNRGYRLDPQCEMQNDLPVDASTG